METKSTTPPLWKQLLGAVAGAALALALYSGYKVIDPQGQLAHFFYMNKEDAETVDELVRIGKTDLSEEKVRRIVGRTQRIEMDFNRGKTVTTEDDVNLRSAAPVEAPTDDWEWREPQWEDVDLPLEPEPMQEEVAPATEVAVASNAPALPSSGVTFWASLMVALGATSGLRMGKKKQ